MTKKTKAVKLISRVMAAVLAFSACQQGILLSAHADDGMKLSEKMHENATVEITDNKITVTDDNVNDDVWNSKALVDTGLSLVPGKQYKIDFELSGEEGVGEFFLCKTDSLDARYDDTFTTEGGPRSTTFTAFSDRLFIGMQVGNVGVDNFVTAEIHSVTEVNYTDGLTLLKTANCEANVDGHTITVKDTDDNNDVWNSKVLFDAGVQLEVGSNYAMEINLTGENGVGEFFVCKSLDLNDRVDDTFTNRAGKQTIRFKAESERLYVGMQFGNVGNGSTVTCDVKKIGEYYPTAAPSSTLCEFSTDENGALVITVTDNSDVNDVWDSYIVMPILDNMIPGEKYEICFELSGDNGVGEFFLSPTPYRDARYDATFTNIDGLNTVVFTADTGIAYLVMQVGNVGMGNSVVAKVHSVGPYNEETGGREELRIAQGCRETITRENPTAVAGTSFSAMDHFESDDVWTSKLLYFFGNVLNTGKEYVAKIFLDGNTDKLGEFYFLKTYNMDDRYTFDDQPGVHYVTFKAEDTKLYAGMQFGNIGYGNNFSVDILDLIEKQGDPNVVTEQNCYAYVTKDTTDKGTVTSLTATDIGAVNDVWDSKMVYSFGDVLEEGKQYFTKVNLSGSVDDTAEFYFLKSDNVDDRYSFDKAFGDHVVSFKAVGDTLYAGMQLGNIGQGNEVTVAVSDILENTPVTFEENSYHNVTKTEGENGFEQTHILGVDNNKDENGWWSSRVLYNLGDILEAGKAYVAKLVFATDAETIDENEKPQVLLTGSNDMFNEAAYYAEDRFDLNQGSEQEKTLSFKADKDNTNLYVGMNFGSVGYGNNFTVDVLDVYQIPYYERTDKYEHSTSEMDIENKTVTVTSTNEVAEGVWNSKALIDACANLEAGVTYQVTVTLEGENGIGELLLLKSEDFDNRYEGVYGVAGDTEGTFSREFVADGSDLFLGLQCGNIGNGNSVKISNIVIEEVPTVNSLMLLSLDEEEIVEETAEEVAEETEEVVGETVEEVVEETVEEVVEETVEVVVEETVEEIVEETAED